MLNMQKMASSLTTMKDAPSWMKQLMRTKILMKVIRVITNANLAEVQHKLWRHLP